MPVFSDLSKQRLATCDKRIQGVFERVIATYDCTILEGHRNEADQEADYDAGKTELHWPHGKHNALPSKAVDAMPVPINWANREQIIMFAGFVLGTAQQMGIKLRWGGDWDGKRDPKLNKFSDMDHFELID
jgi:peptidoglycan LD-endopeptidase CwlK